LLLLHRHPQRHRELGIDARVKAELKASAPSALGTGSGSGGTGVAEVLRARNVAGEDRRTENRFREEMCTRRHCNEVPDEDALVKR
jgi:hypothetical protein